MNTGQRPNSQQLARQAEDHLAAGDPATARTLYHQLARRHDDAGLWIRLAEIDRMLGEHDQALRHLSRAANLQPKPWQASARIAELYFELGRADKSLMLLSREAARDDSNADLQLLLGQAREDTGDREGAMTSYRHALDLRPGWPAALGGLLRSARADARSEWIELGQQVLADTHFAADDRAVLGYALGRVLELRGQYDQAFAAWRTANELRRQSSGGLNHAAARQHIDSQIRQYPADLLDTPCELKHPQRTPVFIVGMPRSGTTLLERMLAAHPDATGFGELPTLGMIARQLGTAPASGESTSLAERYPAETLQQAVDFYYQDLARRSSDETAFVIDKAPMNFFHAGLVALLFPHARIIVCQRDPRDVCLSIYSENFAAEQGFATDLDDLVVYYQSQQRLVDHWLTAMPSRTRAVSYEALVDSPAEVLEPLLEWVGLPWNDDCLAFHQQTGGVHTPSKWQVRQPIYRSSIGRWKHFREHIGPLIEAFGDQE